MGEEKKDEEKKDGDENLDDWKEDDEDGEKKKEKKEEEVEEPVWEAKKDVRVDGKFDHPKGERWFPAMIIEEVEKDDDGKPTKFKVRWEYEAADSMDEDKEDEK